MFLWYISWRQTPCRGQAHFLKKCHQLWASNEFRLAGVSEKRKEKISRKQNASGRCHDAICNIYIRNEKTRVVVNCALGVVVVYMTGMLVVTGSKHGYCFICCFVAFVFFFYLELILVWIMVRVRVRVSVTCSCISAMKPDSVFFMKTTISIPSEMASTVYGRENCRSEAMDK